VSDYLKYRGKCREEAEKLAKKKGYRLVRGYYHEPMWNEKQQHWWCVDDEGNIHDPTAKQFPSYGVKQFYEEFDGLVSCEECGKEITEDEMIMQGPYPVCSTRCAMRLVGLGDL
jgi:formylmethanofuran dehydrogenase subunit E